MYLAIPLPIQMKIGTGGYTATLPKSRSMRLGSLILMMISASENLYEIEGLISLDQVQKAQGKATAIISKKVKDGHLGTKTSTGLFDHGGRQQEEISQKRN